MVVGFPIMIFRHVLTKSGFLVFNELRLRPLL